MKALHVFAKVLLGLLCILPILGTLGVFPAPTADMYTPEAWAFMSAMMNTGYIMPLLGVSFAICFVLLVLNKTALMAVMLAPLTVNIMLFHWALDAAPVSGNSVMAYVLLVLNVYFLRINWSKYTSILR
jgi:putative oxidoreductase